MSIEETEMPKTNSQGDAPQMGETLRDLEERFAPRIEEAKQQLDVMNNRLKGFIRENPAASLAAALGIGYVIGKLASRR
jgi:ElaB/YqjD/DUF883 family membrane-anchored ribosome-binding protein